MENTGIAIGREVIEDKFHFSFVQNFRRAARIIGVDFIERERDNRVIFFAKKASDIQTLKMIADAS